MSVGVPALHAGSPGLDLNTEKQEDRLFSNFIYQCLRNGTHYYNSVPYNQCSNFIFDRNERYGLRRVSK